MSRSGSKFALGARRIGRMSGFILISFILRWPVWLILRSIRIFKPFDYIFLVYPGSDNDLKGYCPQWFLKTWLFSEKPVIGGVIKKGTCGRGLVLVVPNTVDELVASKTICMIIAARLQWIKELTGASSIAMAGQAPGIFLRHGIAMSEPFVRGKKGTVFSVMETINEVQKLHNLKTGRFQVAVVGVGYVGRKLFNSLKEEGHTIIGIDIKADQGIVLSQESKALIQRTDMFIVLTPQGSDFAPYLSLLKEGAIVIDDTHPKIEVKPDNVRFYKVAVGLPGTVFLPRLPGYQADWIPGCAVEAICSAATGAFNGTCQKEFNLVAKELGFYAHTVS